MNTYNDILSWLYKQLPMYQRIGKAAYKADLKTTLELDRALKHPHQNYRSIHIAGTNGKGSVSHALAAIYTAAGYRTGLYTSPHLLDFRERIRVNGTMIDRDAVVGFVEQHQELITQLKPSFFEITVAMAMEHFKNSGVQVAIFETGMGGRLDSTNIIQPVLSIITSISLDHMEFLGDTLPKIATEKGGIIKEQIPVVIGPMAEEAETTLMQISSERSAPLKKAVETFRFQYASASPGGEIHYRYLNLNNDSGLEVISDLHGAYQSENIATLLTALELLKPSFEKLDQGSIEKGLLETRKSGLLGRWMTIGVNPRMICDIAHNQAGVEAVVAQMMQTPHKKLHIVWGMVADKSIVPILQLLPKSASYYFTQPDIPRALSCEKLHQYGSKEGLKGASYPSVAEAVQEAVQIAEPEDLIFIGGSTFVVADLLKE